MPRGVSRYDEALRQGRLWTPRELTVKATAWFDAQEFGTITSVSGVVSQWDDKSGNARHAVQATAANRPAGWGPDKLAPGYAGIEFLPASGGDWLIAPIAGLTTRVTVFTVGFLRTTANNFARIVSLAAAATADFNTTTGAGFCRATTTQTMQSVYNSGLSTAAAVTYLAPFIGELDVGPSTQGVRINTVAAATAAIAGMNFATTSRMWIGHQIDGAGADGRWDGVISEVLVLNSDPSSLERQRIEGYLSHRWGLTANLPASHFYKNSPPLIGV